MRQSNLMAGIVLPFMLAAAPAFAQEAPALAPAEAVSVEAVPAVCCAAPANTVIQLEVVQMLSTKVLSRGDTFEIRLAEPLVIDGKVLLPSGVMGMGQVVHAAGSGIGGKPGELLLAARYLEYDGKRIPLKGMKLGRAGLDNSSMVMAATMVSPLLMFIPGGEVQVAAGTRANAKLAAETIFTPLPAAPPAEPAPVVQPAIPAATPVATGSETSQKD